MKPLEISGIWWLPQFPKHQIAGILNFNPMDGAILSTIGGDFSREIIELFGERSALTGQTTWDLQGSVIPCINGHSDLGKPITLWLCKWAGDVWANGYHGSRLSSQVVFVGCHFEKEEEIVFNQVQLNFTLLDQWLGPDGLSVEFTLGEDNKPLRLQHTYEFHAPSSYSVNEEMSITFDTSASSSGDRVSEASLKRVPSFDVELNNPKSFEDLQSGVVYHVRNFLALATGSGIVAERVRGHSPNVPPISESGRPATIEMYYVTNPGDQTLKPPSRWEMLFRFEDVENDLGRYLGNWIAKSEQLRPVIDLYFSLFYIPSMYVHFEFLTLVQALETYHHKSHPQRRNLRDRLCQVLTTDLESYGEIVDQLVGNREEFVARLVAIRNYLTHYTGTPQDNPQEQRRLAKKMRVLVQLCFCKEIGLPSDMVTKLVSETKDFRNWRF